MTPKEQVEHYIKHDRSLLGGRNLFNKLPGISRAMQNTFARMRDSKQSIAKICYEMAKVVGISPRQLTILMQRPVVENDSKSETPVVPLNPIVIEELTPEDKLLAFIPSNYDYKGLKTLVKSLELSTPNKKKATLEQALIEAKAVLIKSQIEALPEEVKASVKLRDQFPFLRDADCPDVLKLLVNDLITTYEVFKENQPKLHALLGPEEEKLIVALVTDNYIANKQAYAELEHYKSTQTILGEHPLFERLKLKEEISAMNGEDLRKKINALNANITRNKQKDNTDLVERDEDLLQHANEVLAKR